MRLLLLTASICLLSTACSPSPTPDEGRRPDPQSTTAQTEAAPPGGSPITATANSYKDAARNAVEQTQDAAAREQSQIDRAEQ
ncbi:hypothetical protein [Thermomonas sp.]|uniref:hypothetical protein n=1 Tax=Thermomonas sp. TaxID=1971895 RepID=UPI0026055A50|nr:hypothetical protein [Thermomonas sp.]